MKIPLAEHFHSLQGEGLYVGTPMHFLRLPGCTVGHLEVGGAGPILPTGRRAWLCHTHDHRPFWCDTDFNKHSEEELDTLLQETFEGHVCLTGGEPLAHPTLVREIEKQVRLSRRALHIETSGTIPHRFANETWVSVSPKFGCLDEMLFRANELKLLVDQNFDLRNLSILILNHPLVWVQPINKAAIVDLDSVQRCLDILKEVPRWRLSVQLHKFLGVA
jgi:organic radical activating enzyme